MPIRSTNNLIKQLLDYFMPPEAYSRITKTPIKYGGNLPGTAGQYSPFTDRINLDKSFRNTDPYSNDIIRHESTHALLGADLLVPTIKRVLAAKTPEEREFIKGSFMPNDSSYFYPGPKMYHGPVENPAYAVEFEEMGNDESLEELKKIIADISPEKREIYKRLMLPKLREQIK